MTTVVSLWPVGDAVSVISRLLDIRPYHIRPYHIRPYHIRPYHIRPCHIRSYHIRPYLIRPYHISPHHIRPYHFRRYHIRQVSYPSVSYPVGIISRIISEYQISNHICQSVINNHSRSSSYLLIKLGDSVSCRCGDDPCTIVYRAGVGMTPPR